MLKKEKDDWVLCFDFLTEPLNPIFFELTSWIPSRLVAQLNNKTVFTPNRERGWRSGERTRLPPMCPGFDSRTRHHKWVEFPGSLLCSDRFSAGTPVFLFPQKLTIDLIWVECLCSAQTHFNKVSINIIKGCHRFTHSGRMLLLTQRFDLNSQGYLHLLSFCLAKLSAWFKSLASTFFKPSNLSHAGTCFHEFVFEFNIASVDFLYLFWLVTVISLVLVLRQMVKNLSMCATLLYMLDKS